MVIPPPDSKIRGPVQPLSNMSGLEGYGPAQNILLRRVVRAAPMQ